MTEEFENENDTRIEKLVDRQRAGKMERATE